MITTRKGDGGRTFINGEEVSKTSPIIHTIGLLDELLVSLGMVRGYIGTLVKTQINPLLERFRVELIGIQRVLFKVGSEIAKFKKDGYLVTRQDILELERLIRAMEKEKYYKDFHIPGSSFISSLFEHARTDCRSLERNIIAHDFISDETRIFINRLSDYLWLAARTIEDEENPLRQHGTS